VDKLLTDMELENIDGAIKAMGQVSTCMTASAIEGVKKSLKEKGFEGAGAYAAQLTGTDENTELLRILAIFKRYNLGPEASIKVLDNLDHIASGKW
jgi:hypothetical protein